MFVQHVFGPNPPITISRETTYIVAPLDADGLPDYERYLLDRYRHGIDPKQNAAIDILPILGPREFGPGEYELVCQELKLDPKARLADSLVPVNDWSNKKHLEQWLQQQGYRDASLADGQLLVEQIQFRPWISVQAPPIADWLKKNETSLNLLVVAADKPQFYLPSPSLLDDRREMLLHMLLPHATTVRQAAHSLTTRAMWNLGEGRLDQAWRDLHAVFRLARLMAQGHTLVEKLCGINLQRDASRATLALLDDERLRIPLAHKIHRELKKYPDFDGMVDCGDHDERILLLDTIVTNSHTGLGLFRLLSDVGDPRTWHDSLFCSISIDWNPALRNANKWCDRLTTAGRAPTSKERSAALKSFGDDVGESEFTVRGGFPIFHGWFSQSVRSRWAADGMIPMLFPALDLLVAIEDRANSELDLLRLAAALAVYRAEKRSYPESLRDLVPSVLTRLPVDRDNQKQFRYRPHGNGYLLYSVGLNGEDDDGDNEIYGRIAGRLQDDMPDSDPQKSARIPPDSDDYSIRVPTPTFALPKPNVAP